MSACPICGQTRRGEPFVLRRGGGFRRCLDCGLAFREPETPPEEPAPGDSGAEAVAHARHLRTLQERGLGGGRILVSGPVASSFAVQARACGFEVSDEASLDLFDAAVCLRQIDGVPDPNRLLEELRHALRPEGLLFLTLSRVAPRLLGFSPTTIQALLLKSGFGEVWVTPSGSELAVSARPRALRPRPLCSIVVAAYNERPTVGRLLESLLAKEIAGVDKEVIVVESNSTDGTREIVSRFEQHPEVRVLYQDRPRGKGNAVRLGLENARGDVVLIQDADLEYELDDYESLLEPLLRYRAAFVLGSRHAGDWKIRDFSAARGWATYLNLGHVLFTGLVNLLYGQRLADPFTMYKVFWRDCLYGLEFECDRFDFDVELLIKLIRKGYTPLEVPVSYRSRSFEEGKKIRPLRDPLTWILAAFKYRFVALRHRSGIECRSSLDRR